ncbi:hypothetical protein D9756_010218 [Leucocoprinus leucothites]|uniref:Transmembrane protein n=1 Tax=Leucocoprinus leucothites TaxID=201217 RepID=A0A8H5CWJ6_9AGAR|nr:hypothetical protein D9756_010218 [Leucoagaricus leucothites]
MEAVREWRTPNHVVPKRRVYVSASSSHGHIDAYAHVVPVTPQHLWNNYKNGAMSANPPISILPSMSEAPAKPNPFPLTAAQLSGNFCETLFYGMYLVTCTFCARTLLITGSGREERWLRWHEIRWMMAIVAILLFAICTFDTAIGLLHNFHAFVESNDAETELLDIADWINIARSVNQTIAMILGDFVLIYRCWIVYGRRWLVITPSLILYLGNLAMAAKLIEVEANPKTLRGISLNSDQIRPWWLAFFAIVAVQNTLTTGILIWRIWRVEKQSERLMHPSLGSVMNQPRHLSKVIRVIAESGAAYTTCVFVTFLVSVTHSNALYPTSDMTLIATGIAFNVILVRSSARRDHQFTLFDQNERSTIFDASNPTSGSTTIGNSINLNKPSKPQDIELVGMKSEMHSMDRRSSHDGIYPVGVKITTSVVQS